MNFRRNSRSRAPGVQMSSLMDVVFLLLCFFVTTSVYSQWEKEITITLPEASTAKEPGRMPGEIILNLQTNGVVTLNGRVLTCADVTTNLKRIAELYPNQPVPVVIRADKATEYEALVNVIDACRSAGVWNFSLATIKRENEEAK